MLKKKYPKPNEHGVYLEKVCETIEYRSKSNYMSYATIHLVEIGPDQWLGDCSMQLPKSGYGGLPHKTQKSHASRELALFAVLEKIKRYCEGAVRHEDSQVIAIESAKMIAWCDTFKQQQMF